MELVTLPIGLVESNVYLLCFGKDVLMIDAGGVPPPVHFWGMNLRGVLCTHGHFDHICALDELSAAWGCPIFLHEEEGSLFRSSRRRLGLPPEPDFAVTALRAGQVLTCADFSFAEICDFSITVLHTPGHSKGSVCFLYEEREDVSQPAFLFSGDTVFEGTVGRTDLEGGSFAELKASVARIKSLEPGTVILPGHGEKTTVNREIARNPYFT